MNTCDQPLWNLGSEAREVEPQPCGKLARWIAVPAGWTPRNKDERYVRCIDHLGHIPVALYKIAPL